MDRNHFPGEEKSIWLKRKNVILRIVGCSVIDAEQVVSIRRTGTGLKGEYFHNSDFTNPMLTRIDPTVNFDWGSEYSDPILKKDTFTVRWTGFVEPLFTEKYTFYAQSNDSMQLFVNGKLLIDRWESQGAKEYSGTINLEAGKLYEIILNYYENQYNAVSKLFWSSQSQPKQIIPTSALYTPETRLNSLEDLDPRRLQLITNMLYNPGETASFRGKVYASNQKIIASDGFNYDNFGWSVGIDGDYALISAYGDDDNGERNGSAYLFDITNGNFLQKIIAPESASVDWFGYSIAIDENYALIGSYRDDDNGTYSGSAYLFDMSSGEQLQKFIAPDGVSDDYFGYSVAIDGNYALIGSYKDDDNGERSGSAYLFDITTGELLHKFIVNDCANGDSFGYSLAIEETDLIASEAVEGDETVEVVLDADDSYAIASNNSATVTIADNDVANSPPTLTLIDPLTGATEGKSFTISYDDLMAKYDADDADGDAISFEISTIASGTLMKDDLAVVPGVTTLSSGEAVVWTPDTVCDEVSAFTVRAFDGKDYSSKEVPVNVAVAALPIVTINLTDAHAYEAGDVEDLTVTCTGDTTESLEVSFSIAGCAEADTDYEAIDNIIIPAEFSSVKIDKRTQQLKIATEYFSLAILPELSDSEADRLEEIIELALFDDRLSALINQIDYLVLEELKYFEPDELERDKNKIARIEEFLLSESQHDARQAGTPENEGLAFSAWPRIAELSDDVNLAILLASNLDNYAPEALAATQQWVVNVCSEQSSSELAALLGAIELGETGHIANTYIWEFPEDADPKEVASQLSLRVEVGFAYPLVALKLEPLLVPNNELFRNQWHLSNNSQKGAVAGMDANVTTAWDLVTGEGVVIAIVDDGLEYTHPDLHANYRPDLSYDFNEDNIPNRNDDDCSVSVANTHGTAVAGVAAASGNNSLAPDAELAGLRLTADAVSERKIADAFYSEERNQNIQIYNNSWKPPVSGAGNPLSLTALQEGVTKGRGGLGNIYVFGAGNDGQAGENVNYNAFANSRHTIAVGAIEHTGKKYSYSQEGAPLLISAPSGANSVGITTTDIDGNYGEDLDYTNDFGGTSASTPVVSGVIALMLETNPNLTWRDVQHILVETSVKNDPRDEDWSKNAAGHWVNHKYGFGVINAEAAVNAAMDWTPVGEEIQVSSKPMFVGKQITNDKQNQQQSLTSTIIIDPQDDIIVEWVEVVFNAEDYYLGDLEIVLLSPDDTQSVLAEPHLIDSQNKNLCQWVFTSVRHWGESSLGSEKLPPDQLGRWTLQVSAQKSENEGKWRSWKLNLYGTMPTAQAEMHPTGDRGQFREGEVLVLTAPNGTRQETGFL